MYKSAKIREIKRNRLILLIKLILIITLVVKIVPSILLSAFGNKNVLDKLQSNVEDINEANTKKKILKYNLSDLLYYMSIVSNLEIVNFETNSNMLYVIGNEKYTVNVNLINKNTDGEYSISYGINNNIIEENFDGSKNIEFCFKNEGINECYIAVKKDGEILDGAEWNKNVYYVEPYKNQFLEELEKKGIAVHIENTSFDKFFPIYNSLGSQYIRANIKMGAVCTSNGYDFSKEYKILDDLTNANIKILAILGTPRNLLGTDGLVSSDEEVKLFTEYANAIFEHYPQITDYEVWNEPNATYKTDEYIEWYAKTVNSVYKGLKQKNNKINIIAGATSYGPSAIYPVEFINSIAKFSTYKNTDLFSYHIYDISRKGIINLATKNILKENKELENNLGGFKKTANTEFGASTYTNSFSEQEQAIKLVQQYVLFDERNIDYAFVYNFRNTGKDEKSMENNYGIVRNDYTPKLSYYSLKNYYENINGAEYIGTLNIKDGLETHVYDKDGKPIIISWSNNTTKDFTLSYENFIAKDLYGKDIEPDENGNITITTSPVYLYEVDYNYFYEAISNVATSKYSEFKEKFSEEIEQVLNLSDKIAQMENYIAEVGNTQTKIVESASIQAMEKHYELGDLILQAYKQGTLQVEDIKVSSMLDMLDDIGESYQDLVTVSAQNTKSNLEQTNKSIQEVDNLINNNQEVGIIYPSKILEFSKDYYEKATYINSLEEENPIKAGLIISNNLHSELLVNWANTFASIQIDRYIDEYIANNPVTISYSETNLTKQDVKATLTTNAEVQITNNSNSKIHTFKENGSFTFEYTIKGRAFKITATVNNIDKLPPTISGVSEGKLYLDKVTPIINDKNLKEIKLILNGEVVTNYKSGTELTEEGFYEITATDKAGNTSNISFQVLVNKDDNYKIQGNIINNISPNTKKTEFVKKIGLAVSYTITRDGEEIEEKDKIATGDILTTKAGDQYTLIVPGDINKDGEVNLKDFIEMRIYLLEENNLDNIEKIAADCDLDGKTIGVKDFIRMRLIILMQDIA